MIGLEGASAARALANAFFSQTNNPTSAVSNRTHPRQPIVSGTEDVWTPTGSNPARERAKGLTDLALTGARKAWVDQSRTVNEKRKALETLRAAMSSFERAASRFGDRAVMVHHAVRVSQSDLASVETDANALPGEYRFVVEQVASRSQKALSLPERMAATGELTVRLANGASFAVDLEKVPVATPGQITARELARAVSDAARETGQVHAVPTDLSTSGTMLMLSSAATGAASEISLAASGNVDAGLSAALADVKNITRAGDLVVRLGAANGPEVRQPSNTFTGLAGLAVTFDQAAPPSSSITVRVENDFNAAAERIGEYVSAYNHLLSTIRTLVKPGNAAAKRADGPLAREPGMQLLASSLEQLHRKRVGKTGLSDIGIASQVGGTLQLDRAALRDALTRDAGALSKVFAGERAGQNIAPSPGNPLGGGLLPGLSAYLNTWLRKDSGEISRRLHALTAEEARVMEKEQTMTVRYERLYQKYLKEFTAAERMQREMEKTLKYLDDIFSTDRK